MKNTLAKVGVCLASLLCLPGFIITAAETVAAPGTLPASAKSAPALAVGTSLENLMITFTDESNAQAKYLAYAKKADLEGYHKAAKLFRATAMAQGIHAQGHAQAIKSMGGKAQTVAAQPAVGTTKENLATALKEENYKVETQFPAYLQKAVAEKNIKAQHIFGGLQAVESVHAKWYAAALANLESWKTSGDFFVCKVCGNVVDKMDFEYCPICKAPVSEFVKIQ
jgi:rubrerythrin